MTVDRQAALRALLAANGPVVVTEGDHFKEAVATAYAHLGEGGDKHIHCATSGRTAYAWFPGDGLSVLWIELGETESAALRSVGETVDAMPHKLVSVTCGSLLKQALGWNPAVQPWGGGS